MHLNIPIYLNVYNFTNMNSFLSSCGMGGYHTGIEIKDLEFCFCVVDSDPNETGVIAIEPQSAEYEFNRKIFLGETSLTGFELEAVIQELSAKYTCGAYHIFKSNCNHFSQQLAYRLTGKQIPKWIFRSTNFLTYLCCCLPTGMVSGRWAIEALEEEMREEQDDLQSDLYRAEKNPNNKYFNNR